MKIDDKSRNEKQLYYVNRGQQKYQHYYQVKLMKMNISQVRKYYPLIKLN